LNETKIEVQLDDTIQTEEVLGIYKANGWSSAEKPVELMAALQNSHTLATARFEGRLVGIGNAISDGHLVVCYPHMLVHPDFQRQGIGRTLMSKMQERFRGFHQQILLADGDAVAFYESIGFSRASRTVPMWIYKGDDH